MCERKDHILTPRTTLQDFLTPPHNLPGFAHPPLQTHQDQEQQLTGTRNVWRRLLQGGKAFGKQTMWKHFLRGI